MMLSCLLLPLLIQHIDACTYRTYTWQAMHACKREERRGDGSGTGTGTGVVGQLMSSGIFGTNCGRGVNNKG